MDSYENSPSENGSGQPQNSRRDRAAHLIGHRFRPGTSGNPGGRPRHDTLDEILRDVFKRETDDGLTIAERFVAQVIARALKGDSKLARVLWERHDGRNPIPVHVSGPGGGPILVVDAAAREQARIELASWREEQLRAIQALDLGGAPT